MFVRVSALLALALAVVLFSGSLSAPLLAADEAHAEGEHDTHAKDSHAEDSHGGGHGGDHGGHHDLGHGNAGKDLENVAEFRSDLAVYTFAVFFLLLMILGKFAWPSISAALLEREKRIEANIADAEKMNAEAKDMLAQHEAKLASAADEVRELLEEARRDAEHTKGQIIAEAKEQADKERERAVREVEIASDRAMHKLAETSANMAVDWAGKVAKQTLTEERHAEIVREALGTLANSSPSQN